MAEPSILTKDCIPCKGTGWKWTHDPSLDGHGGLNGGGYTWRWCYKCKNQARLRCPDRCVTGEGFSYFTR